MTKPKTNHPVIESGVTYRGKLATRINVTPSELSRQNLANALLIWGGEESLVDRSISDKVFDERLAKFPKLFELFKVPKGHLFHLAYALACAHVPGFQLGEVKKRGVGRPKNDISTKEIYALFARFLDEHPGANVAGASKHLTAKGAPLAKLTPETARRQYYAGRKMRKNYPNN